MCWELLANSRDPWGPWGVNANKGTYHQSTFYTYLMSHSHACFRHIWLSCRELVPLGEANVKVWAAKCRNSASDLLQSQHFAASPMTPLLYLKAKKLMNRWHRGECIVKEQRLCGVQKCSSGLLFKNHYHRVRERFLVVMPVKASCFAEVKTMHLRHRKYRKRALSLINDFSSRSSLIVWSTVIQSSTIVRFLRNVQELTIWVLLIEIALIPPDYTMLYYRLANSLFKLCTMPTRIICILA